MTPHEARQLVTDNYREYIRELWNIKREFNLMPNPPKGGPFRKNCPALYFNQYSLQAVLLDKLKSITIL
jgi:hypothetical protein